MYALTIQQPYASLIVGWPNMPAGIRKRVENRSWRPPRDLGALAIHAGKSRTWLATWDGPVPPQMPFGCIVGTAAVLACFPIESIRDARAMSYRWRWLARHMHAHGPYCWVLGAVHRFEDPIPMVGKQGLWRVDDALLTGKRLRVEG